jgi:4-amino-4-deoxy-L-arabinose transferase-like glycosyltransferase
MVLPALGLAYVLSGPGSALRRAGQLAAATVVVVLVSLSWMTAVSLVPAADRPYVDGSHNNSVFEQVFTYNGFGRFGNQTPLQIRAEQLNPGAAIPPVRRSPDRLLRGALGRDTGWLIPAGVIVAAWGIAARRRQPRGDPLRACFVLWGGWLLTFFVTFSVVTVLQPYYTAALSPSLAALIGAGFAAASTRDQAPVAWTAGLAAIVAASAAYAAWLASSSAGAPGWLVPAIIAAGVAAVIVIVWPLAGRGRVPAAVTLLAGLTAVMLAPATASVSLAARGEGASDTPFEPVRVQQAIAMAAGQQALVTVRATIPTPASQLAEAAS